MILRNSPGNEDELSAEEKKKLKHKKKREAHLDYRISLTRETNPYKETFQVSEMVPRTNITCRYLNPPVNVPGTKARAESHVPLSHWFQPAGLDDC